MQVSDPIYNLDPTHKYNIQRRTTNLKISYYVKDSFSADFTGSLKKLEREVEDVYVQRMRDACFRERAYKVFCLFTASFKILSLISYFHFSGELAVAGPVQWEQ